MLPAYQVWRNKNRDKYAEYMRTYQRENYTKYKKATLQRKRRNYLYKTECNRLRNILLPSLSEVSFS